MIKRIETYIITNGNGLEALDFYLDVFEAKLLSKMLWKDGVPNCPKEHENLLLNAQLEVNGIRIMISDENPNNEYKVGYNITPTIITNSVEESKKIYDKLSKDAKEISMELQETFWSKAYANLIDKYNVMWQISTEI